MKSKTILDYLQYHHLAVNALCNGHHQCGQCKIKVLNRELIPTNKEKELLTINEIHDGIRLACFHEYKDHDEIVSMNQSMEILDDLDDINSSDYQGIGLIVDIGTTTIVMKWINRETGNTVDTASFVNPQVTFGGDVISRIHAYNQDKKDVLNQILVNSIEERLIDRDIEVNQMIFCGNTTMIHFLLNEEVTSLGVAPFIVPRKEMQRINSRDIFKMYKYNCELITFPHISAYVGGDIVSGIYACELDMSDKIILMIDLGTNGEMVIGNKYSLLVTSTAAGPAFEGVGISCGGSSVDGAISSIKLKPLQIKTINNKKPQFICGSGLISLFGELVRNELISPIGKIYKDKQIDITNNIYINQSDISHFQLAKAAVQTGVTILLEEYSTDTIYIAGGFGSHIDVEDLKDIQVIPKDIKNIKSLGNSALKGCYKLLMTQDFDRVINIVDKAVSMNLADHEDFEDTLIESLYFYD